MAVVVLRVQQRGLGEAALLAAVLLAPAAALVAPLFWRLRTDDAGLSRRLFGLVAFWPWRDFARGVIEKRLDGSMVHTEWAWWNPRRRLALPLEGPERREVINAINQHYRAPAPPDPPEALNVRVGLKRYRFDPNGVHFNQRKQPRTVLWSQVKAVDIVRTDPQRNDFQRLELVLPAVVIDFRFIQGNAGWRGAEADELVAFLRAHVDEQRISTWDGNEPLPNREWVERRTNEAEKSARDLRNTVVGLAAVAFVCGGWIAFNRGLLAAAAMTSLLLIPTAPGYAHLVFVTHRIAHAWRRIVDDDTWRTASPPDEQF